MNYTTSLNVFYRGLFFSEFTEPRMGQVYNAIANDLPMSFDSPLNMEFDMSVEGDFDPLKADLQTWSGFMTLGGTAPIGSYAIISEKLWDIIKDLRMPPQYNLVPIRLMYNSKVRHFYLFHMYNTGDKYVDFENCIYEEGFRDRLKRETTILNRTKGGFRSREEAQYLEYSEDQLTYKYRFLRITALKENFDIFWSTNAIRMNSSTKELFLKNIDDLHGVAISEVKIGQPIYICPEEYHLLDQDLDELLDSLS